MDSRSIAFLEVMGGIAVLALVCFVIAAVARWGRAADGAAPDVPARHPVGAHYPMILAATLLVVACAVLVWQLDPLSLGEGKSGPWRTQTGASSFFVVMLIAAGLAVLGFLVVVWMRARTGAVAAPAQEAAERTGSSLFVPVVGIAILIAALLLLNWTYVAGAQRYRLMLSLAYPGAFAVILVLILDKASRAEAGKQSAESFREWLFCDGLAFLLVLGFVNLAESGADGKYVALFWDTVQILAVLVVFWIIDRTAGRMRFLLGYAYVTLAPVLLVIWRASQGVATPDGISWWQTLWPIFYLSLGFFILELAVLLSARAQARHGMPAVKDAVFFLLYGVLLLVALPATGE